MSEIGDRRNELSPQASKNRGFCVYFGGSAKIRIRGGCVSMTLNAFSITLIRQRVTTKKFVHDGVCLDETNNTIKIPVADT